MSQATPSDIVFDARKSISSAELASQFEVAMHQALTALHFIISSAAIYNLVVRAAGRFADSAAG